MQTGLHRPHFKFPHLAVLVAALASPLSGLPYPASSLALSLILVITVLHSMTDRISPLEWAVIFAIGAVLFALLMPAVSHDNHRWRGRSRVANAKNPVIPRQMTPVPVPIRSP
jgi:amino acid transporter